jgi:adenine-specific DNA-methyltransferase
MTRKRETEKVSRETGDVLKDAVDQLKVLFPQAVAEGKVDFDKLRAALGDAGDDRPERYSFSWAGKRDAIRLLQTPSRATLKPAPKESIAFDTTQNVFIEGDNLEVLKLLYKPYFGRVR